MGRVVAGTGSYDAMPVVGYCDRSSVAAGGTVTFYVSARGTPTYSAELVRLLNGDTNPLGPGVKEQVVDADFAGEYPSIVQETHVGSYAVLPDHKAIRGGGGLSIQTVICPSMLGGRTQAVMTKWSPTEGSGYGLFITGATIVCDGGWLTQ